jgi:2,4-dienoyl-CoA reductase-like NADH-dependent reductase (Old Yellow Enzyme family)
MCFLLLNACISPKDQNKEECYFSEITIAIKNAVTIPVILTGGIVTINAAENHLSNKSADFIGVGSLRD